MEMRLIINKYLFSVVNGFCFGVTLNDFVVFLGEAQPKNRYCLSEVRASFAILSERALEKQEIIHWNGKTRTIYQPF